MARSRTVIPVLALAVSGCASTLPPSLPEAEPLRLDELGEGDLAAIPPLGPVLVRGREGQGPDAIWEFASEMKTLRIPEGALAELGLRNLATPAEVQWAFAFLDSDFEVEGQKVYDPKRAMAWMQSMRTGLFPELVTTFGQVCRVGGARDLQAIERSLLDTARTWLVAEIAAVKRSPPDGVDDALRGLCPAL